ncbi:MAG TPA: SapC family protein [Gallionella sp.]|nr:SapC family protein [Gallionella sp.]
MTTQQLIYEKVIPVSSGRHGDCSVEVGGDFSFSRNVNSVPLMAVEFPHAAPEYPIVFAGADNAMIPAVILGVRNNENLYLSKDGKWQAKYIPAFIRRYPFVFSNSQDGKTFTLCIDEDFPGFNREGRGQRLFDQEGKPTPFVNEVLKFLQDYRAQFMRTQAFCKKLTELDLLVPMQAQFTLTAGEKMSLSGFKAVDRKKLTSLPGDTLAELAKTDELELLYLHLQSMRNFSSVSNRMVVIEGGKKDEPGTQEAGKEETADLLSEQNEGESKANAKGFKKFLNRGKDK